MFLSIPSLSLNATTIDNIWVESCENKQLVEVGAAQFCDVINPQYSFYIVQLFELPNCNSTLG